MYPGPWNNTYLLNDLKKKFQIVKKKDAVAFRHSTPSFNTGEKFRDFRQNRTQRKQFQHSPTQTGAKSLRHRDVTDDAGQSEPL